MGRRIKWIIGIPAAVIGILIIAAYVFLACYDFNDLKPRIIGAVREATGRELTIAGDIDLEIGFNPSLVLTDISLQNASWGSRPEMVKLRRLEVRVALLPLIGRNIQIRRFVLIGPDVLIERDKAGRSNLAFGKVRENGSVKNEEERTAGGTGLPAVACNRLEIIDGRLAYRDEVSGRTGNVRLNSLTARSAGMDSPVELVLAGDVDSIAFTLSGTLGPLAAAVDPEKPWSVQVTAEALDATAALEGSIRDLVARSGVDVGFKVRVHDWEALSKLSGRPVPFGTPLEVAGRAGDDGPECYRVSDLTVSLGENRITGSAGIRIKQEIPELDIALSSDHLDLRPFLSREGGKRPAGKAGEKAAVKKDKIFPGDPLPPLDALKQVDGTFKVRFGRVVLPRLVVHDLSMDATVEKGRLQVRPVKAVIGGGILEGDVVLTPHDKTADVAARLSIKDLLLEKMLKELDMKNLVEGKLEVDMDLRGRGASVAEIMAGLNGHTILIMNGGSIKNKYIGLLGSDMSSSVFRLLNPAREKKEYTVVHCMVSRFDIQRGHADSTALVLDTERMSVVGEGDIDLGTEKLNLSIKPVPKEGIGGFSLNPGELARPFKLGGTLANPSLALDPTQTAITLGKAVGGAALFGPVGIVAALIRKSRDGKDENPCLAAIEAAKAGPSGKEETVEEKEESQKPGNALKDVLPNIGKTLKGLFGR